MSVRGWTLRRAFRAYEWLRACYRELGEHNHPLLSDSLPVPPATLRYRVAGTPSVEAFLDGGRKGAECVRELLAASGQPLENCGAVLDFGCGCGRVLRNWGDVDGTSLFGTDLDAELIRWCREYLPFVNVSTNGAEPPTTYPGSQFDAVYAFSVFTHMPHALQMLWLDEFRRILKPGGVLLFSTHGSYYLPRLGSDEQRRFLGGELVVRFARASGSNLCNTFHPEAFVRKELAPGWDVAAFVPEGARGNPRQDAWVFRRRR